MEFETSQRPGYTIQAPPSEFVPLTYEEEFALATTIQQGVAARTRLGCQDQPPTPEEYDQLNIAVTKSFEAVKRLVESNLRLVGSIVRRYPSHLREDIGQIGTIGLLQAAWKYDPQKGSRFSTYAYRSISHEIYGEATNLTLPLDLPESMIDYYLKIREFASQYQMKNGKLPSVEEITLILGRDPSKESDLQLVKKYIADFSRLTTTLSLNEPASSDEAEDRIDLLPSKEKSLEERLCNEDLTRWLDGLDGDIDSLSQIELGVLYLRSQSMTFSQVGEHFNMPKQHAHRIHKRALEKLKNS